MTACTPGSGRRAHHERRAERCRPADLRLCVALRLCVVDVTWTLAPLTAPAGFATSLLLTLPLAAHGRPGAPLRRRAAQPVECTRERTGE